MHWTLEISRSIAMIYELHRRAEMASHHAEDLSSDNIRSMKRRIMAELRDLGLSHYSY